MRTKDLVIRLGALAVVALLGLWYILFSVADWRLGAQNYKTTVMLPRAGGIFPDAAVDYRAVTVGRVLSLSPEANSVKVVLSIYPGQKIPSNVGAYVRSINAAGEQYIDLVPPPNKVDPQNANALQDCNPADIKAPPVHGNLKNGSTISEGFCKYGLPTVPVQIGDLLNNLGLLLNTLPTGALDNLTQALGQGFTGTTQQLQQIVQTGQSVVRAFIAAQAGTTALVNNAQPLLKAFQNTDTSFSQFASSINALTGTLANDSGDFNSLMSNGVTLANNTNALLQQEGPALASGLNNGAALFDTIVRSDPNALAALFQELPLFAGDIGSVVGQNGLRVETSINTAGGTPVCSYLPSGAIPLPTQPIGQADLTRGGSCAAGGSPSQILRGAANTP